ncbi:MAG: PEP-CTERM sorting domain-containing protein [Planctomycetota bacterium]
MFQQARNTVCMAAGLAITTTASAQLTDYSQDFESLDRTVFSALTDDGWLTFGGGIDNPTDRNFAYTFGPFGTPNDIANPFQAVISDVPSGGDPPAGSQGLVILSDYNSDSHQVPDGLDLLLAIFQQQTIGAGDVGKTVTFEYLVDGNATPPSGNAVAEAFILALDSEFFFEIAADVNDTTSVADGDLLTQAVSLTITNDMVGDILQFGFRSIASDFEGSAVDYDNLVFTVPEPASIGLAAAGLLALSLRRRGK